MMDVDNNTNPIFDDFHKAYYYDSDNSMCVKWFGIPLAQKCPLDLWVYQEIIYEVKPTVVIETGTGFGGTTMFLAHMLDLLGQGMVISVDSAIVDRPMHHRISYVAGSSIAQDTIRIVKDLVMSKYRYRQDNITTLVLLDSDTSKDHVLEELRVYSQMVSRGSYIIVCNTNLNGHPVHQEHGPGPMEAVKEFLYNNDRFQVDTSREKYGLTFNPMGYIKKRY